MAHDTLASQCRELARDLSREHPRSPREKLAGYVIAGRTLDKCRAHLCGCAGEYHFGCPLDHLFLDFTGISEDAFRDAVAEGRTDAEMARWIEENAAAHSEEEIVRWNNDLRYKRISEMEPKLQVFLEGYIDEVIPQGRGVHHWFDVYDIEEGRL